MDNAVLDALRRYDTPTICNALERVAPERQGYGVVNPGPAVSRALREKGGPLRGLLLSPTLEDDHVTFTFHAPTAHPFSVIGGFNGWDPEVNPMEEERPGVWRVRIRRPSPGVWSYKFLLSDGSWTDDPENPVKEPDGCGDFNSKLLIP